MATVIGLGVQFSANASGMTKGLSQADRQLQNLGKQAAQASRLFDSFASSSGAAATAQQQVATDLAFLNSAFKTGQISAEQYATELQSLVAGAQDSAAAFSRAAKITQDNLTAQQRYDAEVQELTDHLAAGRISQETYNAAVAKSSAEFAKATVAAARLDGAVADAGDGGTLQFNELSGVLSALPGPIGNVAGRLSGLASAGEGLGRIFSGGAGLSGGLASIGTSVAGLVNPFTVGLAAVAAFGAGATAVARGLLDLEDRVENLGGIADKLGVSFEFIQTLEEAANRSGTSIDSVSAAFGRLQKSVLGVDEESKAAQKALAEIGVEAEALQQLGPEEQYRLIGERLSAIEDPAKRTAAATALFGNAGADLIPFFKNIGPAATDIERLGGALSQVDRERIDDFGAGIDALGVASSRMGELLILPFTGLGEGIAKGSAEFLGGVNAIVGPIGDVLQPVLAGLGAAFETVGVVIGGIGRSIGTIVAPIGDLAQAFGLVGESFNDAFVDVVRYLVDSAASASELVASFSPLNAVTATVEALGDNISRISNIIGTAFSLMTDYIGDVLGAWAEFFGIQGSIEQIGQVITSAFGSVSATFETISDAIGGTVGRLLTIAEEFLGIKNDVETPIVAELDLSQPNLAATQFAKEIGNAATKAAEFGEAGFQAALTYQQALEQIAQLQADGTLSAEEGRRAAELAGQAFESTLGALEQEASAQKAAADAAQKAADEKIDAARRAADAQVEADRRRADSFIASQRLGGEDPATKAAEDLLTILRQIDETETAIVEARARGDKAAETAAIKRLQILDQAQAAAEQVVSFGFSDNDVQNAIEDVRDRLGDTFSFDNFELAPEAFRAAQEQLRNLETDLQANVIDPKTFEIAADAIREGFEDALKTAEKISKLNEQYAERYAEIESERIAELAKVSQQPLKAADIRTSEGIGQVLGLATGREDPAIEQRREQLAKLEEIKKKLVELGSYPVEIIGAGA